MSIDNNLDYTLSLATQSKSTITGKGYYGIPVIKEDEVELMIQIFDSTDESCDGGTNCVTDDQLKAFIFDSGMRERLGVEVETIAFSHQAVPEMIYLWNNSAVYNEKHSPTRCVEVGENVTEWLSKVEDLRYLVMGNDQFNSYGGTFNEIEMMYAPTSSGVNDD